MGAVGAVWVLKVLWVSAAVGRMVDSGGRSAVSEAAGTRAGSKRQPRMTQLEACSWVIGRRGWQPGSERRKGKRVFVFCGSKRIGWIGRVNVE